MSAAITRVHAEFYRRLIERAGITPEHAPF
jgi:hypothetical protein